MRTFIKTAASFLAITIIVILLALFSTSPSNELNFATSYKILPTSSLNGSTLTIENLRDFTYTNDGAIKEVRYTDKDFSIKQLKQTWLGISHFQTGGLAHVFLSFEFAPETPDEQADFLVVSIEARLTETHNHYSPIQGLFRQYNKTVVLATEQDVIGLRSHIRKERVLLYPLRINNIQQHALLLNFLRMSNDLIHYPDFYNTLTDNCLTGLMAQSYYFQTRSNRFDYRILLPGYSDGLAHEHGMINLQGDLNSIRQQAIVAPNNFNIQAVNFSQLLRRKPD